MGRGKGTRTIVIVNSFRNLFRFLTPTYYNDTILRAQRQQHEGAYPRTEKIAIYVIFPQYGVQDSHLHSLRYLVENGYSPIVVSNLPLMKDDLTRLKPLAWQIMQRQNFGYDFGGYRDAVLDLAADLPKLERLVFLNDSSWFPLAGKANWLRLAEDSGKDVYAAEQHRGSDLAGQDQARNDHKVRPPYFASYAISLGVNVLRDHRFFQFWRNLRISNGKGRTVRRGEHGHSHWLRSQGFTCDALSKNDGIRDALAGLSEDQFAHIWRTALLSWNDESSDIFQQFDIPNPDSAWRAKQRDLIANHIAYTGVAIVLPQFAITHRNYPFLKKSVSGRNIATLRQTIMDLNDPMSPQMLQEFDQRYGA